MLILFLHKLINNDTLDMIVMRFMISEKITIALKSSLFPLIRIVQVV